MGRYTPIVLLGVAVVIALVTSVATYNWLQQKRAMPEVQTPFERPWVRGAPSGRRAGAFETVSDAGPRTRVARQQAYRPAR